MTYLYDFWLEVWNHFGFQSEPLPVFDDIINRYSEPHRRYHNVGHLEFCLRTLVSVRFLFDDNHDEFYTVMLALFFHDVVYDPAKSDNEEQSALLAQKVIKDAHLQDQFGQKVAKYILATRHTEIATDFYTQIICDIDLCPLGLPPEEYDANTIKIRQEYSMYSKEEFVAGRTKFTEIFLARPSIFQTWYFQEKYEGRAWENLAVSLAWMSQYPFDP